MGGVKKPRMTTQSALNLPTRADLKARAPAPQIDHAAEADDTAADARMGVLNKKKKGRYSTLLAPASGRGLSGGDATIQRKNLLGS